MLLRDTWAEIKRSNIMDNYQTLKDAINNKDIFPVLKGNAYGHGIEEIGKLFNDSDVPFVCVATLGEAHDLLDAGVTKDILVFSYVDPRLVLENKHDNLMFSIPSLDWYEKLQGQGRFHLVINTSMNRMGITNLEVMHKIVASKHKDIEGIYTHFPTLDDDEKAIKDVEYFKEVVEALDYDFKHIHAGNIALKLYNDYDFFTGFRIGMGLFGYREDIELKPALNLYTEVIYRVNVEQGDTVGYSRAYEAKDDVVIATLPIGYADGFLQDQDRIPLIINGKEYSIVGNVCMDQLMVAVDDSVHVGDRVELIGDQRTIGKLSNEKIGSAYTILVGLGRRIDRIYK